MIEKKLEKILKISKIFFCKSVLRTNFVGYVEFTKFLFVL